LSCVANPIAYYSRSGEPLRIWWWNLASEN